MTRQLLHQFGYRSSVSRPVGRISNGHADTKPATMALANWRGPNYRSNPTDSIMRFHRDCPAYMGPILQAIGLDNAVSILLRKW